MNLIDIFESLASVSSRNEKLDILTKNESDILKQVLLYAYDPFKRFNISSKLNGMMGKGSASIESLGDQVFSLLDKLSTRELSGNSAVAAVSVFAESLDTANFDLLRNIIKKDLRCGVSDSTINKVFKNLVPGFDVQLAAAPIRISKMQYPALATPKLDGMRCVAIYDGETVEFLSRSGKEIRTLGHIEAEVKKLLKVPGVLDCEAMSDSFNDTMSSINRKTAKDTSAKLHVFDYMSYEDFSKGECNVKQSERLVQLSALFDYDTYQFIEVVPDFVVKNEEEAYQKYNEFRAQGHEGAIIKNMSAPYLFKRNDGWVKIKPSETEDFPIIGFEEGTGKYEGMLGALILDLGNDVTTNVGTGFSDEQRKEIWENRARHVDDIAEVEFMEKTVNKDGTAKLRHSRFIRFRSIAGSKA